MKKTAIPLTPAATGSLTPSNIVPQSLMKLPMWEPKTQNRFMVHIIDNRWGKNIPKPYIIEPYLVKYIDRPGFETIDGERVWKPIKLRIYEVIVPGHTLFKCISAGTFDVQVHELGPVGDIIETWHMSDCRFSSVKSNPLDWSSDCELQEVECELDWKEIFVKDGDSEFKISREK